MVCIELNNITYKYPLSDENAVENLTCKFEEGKFYGIIGENGGGKTTLCNIIRGLIPNFYKGDLTGQVKVLGKDISEWKLSELSVKIGYVFQNPFTQISGIKETVFEEIAMGMENMGVPKEEMIEKVVSICKTLHIEELMEKDPNELSGGQRQRVAFASIIAMDTDILVIDEHTSQLDPKGTEEIFEIIKVLKKAGKTIILVEHKIDLIAEYCDEIVVMEKGKIILSGPTKDVLSRRLLPEHGVAVPQVAVLGHRLRDAGKNVKEIPVTVEEAVKVIENMEGKNGD